MIIQRFSSFASLVVTSLDPLQFDSVCIEKGLGTMGYEKMTNDEVVSKRALIKYFSHIGFEKIPQTQLYCLQTTSENVSIAMANPFRTTQSRKEYNNVCTMYGLKHPNLFRKNGERNKSNAVGEMFWRGYDGVGVDMWDSDSKKMIAYIHWRAGFEAEKTNKG